MSAITFHSSQLVMLPTLALGSVVALIMGATCLTIDPNFFLFTPFFSQFFNWEQLLQKSNTHGW
jgi:hypothetical protein